jgi:hypothetical protein
LFLVGEDLAIDIFAETRAERLAFDQFERPLTVIAALGSQE